MTDARLAMEEHLYLTCPTQEEEIAEGGIVTRSDLTLHITAGDDDMEAPPHVVRAKAADDGATWVIVHIAHHGSEVTGVIGTRGGVAQADGIVVIIIPEGAECLGMSGIVLTTLARRETMKVRGRWRHGRSQRRLRDKRGQHRQGRLRWGQSRLWLGRGGKDGTPSLGACDLEAPDDLTEAPVHTLLHLDDTMEMVGHADSIMNAYLTPLGGFMSRDTAPLLHDRLTYRTEHHGRCAHVVIEPAKDAVLVLSVTDDKGDEIDAGGIVIMTWVVWTI